MDKEIKLDPRCTLTLENIIRMCFHPLGVQRFMEGVNDDLNLGPIQSSFNLAIGTTLDFTKYFPFAVLLYNVASNYLGQ